MQANAGSRATRRVLSSFAIVAVALGIAASPALGQSTGADLSLSVTDSPDPVTPGGAIAYTLSITNDGPDTAEAVYSQSLPPYGAGSADFFPGSGCSYDFEGPVEGQISCSFGNVAPGQTVTRSFVYYLDGASWNDGDTLHADHRAAAATEDPDATDNDRTTTTRVATPKADISLSVTDSPDPVAPDGAITYALSITNHGPDTAEAVYSQSLPPFGAGSGSFPPASGCSYDFASPVQGQISCSFGNIAPGQTVTRSFIYVLDAASWSNGGTVHAEHDAIAAATDDPDPTDNGRSTTTAVHGNSAPAPAAGGPYSLNEGATTLLTGSATDVEGDAITYAWDHDGDGFDDGTDPGSTFSAAAIDGPAVVTVRLRACDAGGCAVDDASVSVANVAPDVSLTPPTQAIATGATASVTIALADPAPADRHTATVDWGDGGGAQPVGTIADGRVLTHAYAARGSYTVTTVVTDDDGESDTAQSTVDVNSPPVANAGPDQLGDEGATFTLDGSASSDPDAETLTYSWAQTAGPAVTLDQANSAMPSFTALDDGTYEFELAVADASVTTTDRVTVSVANVAPTVGPATGPETPLTIGGAVNVSAPFGDPGTDDTHTGTIDWGDGARTPAHISEGRNASGGHAYARPGVYIVTVTVVDDDGGTGSSTFEYVVVFDPDGGFVIGSGWFNSPAGAYKPDPLATGRGTFGFVSQYRKRQTVPTGKTRFRFETVDMSFESTSLEGLVVSGPKAQYHGRGTINGAGDYAFTLTARDASPDRLRIEIWDPADGQVIYDNQTGTSDTADATTAIGGGSIVVHKAS